MSTLKQQYKTELARKVKDELQIKNVMAVPRLSKIVVNMGVKDAVADKKNIERMTEIMAKITGQKPRVARAKKSIATFKLRAGDPIGLVVTLRGQRMYDFYEKLVSIVFPRFRDFRGVPVKSFDKAGNYTLGLSEYSVFPEIDLATVERVQGLEIVIVTTGRTPAEGKALLTVLGMPFEKPGQNGPRG